MAAMEFIKKTMGLIMMAAMIQFPLTASPAFAAAQAQTEAEQFKWPPNDAAVPALPATATPPVAEKGTSKAKPFVDSFMVTSPLSSLKDDKAEELFQPEIKSLPVYYPVAKPAKAAVTRIFAVEVSEYTPYAVKVEGIVSNRAGAVLEMRVGYEPTGGGLPKKYQTMAADPPGTGSYVTRLDKLRPDTEYTFQIEALYPANNNELVSVSLAQSFKTLPAGSEVLDPLEQAALRKKSS